MKTNIKRMALPVLSLLLCMVLLVGCTPDTPSGSSISTDGSLPAEAITTDTNTTDEDVTNSNTTTVADTTVSATKTPSSSVGKTTTATKTTTTTSLSPQDTVDKPKVANTANLLTPMKGKSDSQANTLRQKIVNSKNGSAKIRGTTYYVSHNGNDANDGKSPKTAWKSLGKLGNSLQIRSGDAVLFERGGVYRGIIKAISGVYYGAYGSGDKPCIYVSKGNLATQPWKQVAKNVWCAPDTWGNDVGNVIFNHGEHAGDRKFTKAELKEKYDFYFGGGRLYVCTNKDPSKEFYSIEAGYYAHAIQVGANAHDITIENFTIKYGGAHAVQCSTGVKNITVKNCEIGWMGGSVLSTDGSTAIRFGNGIEFWEACEDVLVENNWIYQIYDSGLSHQGKQKFVVKDLIFRNNLVEFTSYAAIEYWAPSKSSNSMVNICYEGNILRFSGYGWGEMSRPNIQARAIQSGGADNYAENFVIRNNIMDTAKSVLVAISSSAETLPKLDGNTYIQSRTGRLGVYSFKNTDKAVLFDKNVLDVIKNAFGDKNAKVLYAD